MTPNCLYELPQCQIWPKVAAGMGRKKKEGQRRQGNFKRRQQRVNARMGFNV